jgi:predicted nuclease of restriction endonuclease-like (RecB) superfamily
MPTKKSSPAQKLRKPPPAAPEAALFDRVAGIIEQAQTSVVRAVNNSMVLAYWLIGREIVRELQGGRKRAAYGKEVLTDLSKRLGERYGRGFSITNLQNFRLFHLTYANRVSEIQHIGCAELAATEARVFPTARIRHIRCGESEPQEIQHIGCAVLEHLSEAAEQVDAARGFSPNLGWSHYRALMRVENRVERLFYEIEADHAGWDVETLERQIHTFLFARLLKSRNKEGVMALIKAGQEVAQPIDAIKNPYVLDFLNLPESDILHESKLEAAIIGNLQAFLLELGKGFAFVARQKRIDFDGDCFYIDLVFYHCILKCYVLIDLKLGKLTHQDAGQMDSYVRLYDDMCRSPGDNPTIGLILCSEKSGAIARYSVLHESKQIFASTYMLHLPTEEELRREIERERRLIEERAAARDRKTKPSI